MAEKIIKALVQCVKKQQQLIPIEESLESTIGEGLTFGVVDTITKTIGNLVKKIRCSLSIIGQVIGEGELTNVFEDFKDEVLEFLKTDIHQCMKAESLSGKLK